MVNEVKKVIATNESIKCYYCLRNPSSIPYNDIKYSLFLEKTKNAPYKVCFNCWSILRSLKIIDDLFLKFIKEDGIITKPKTAFKFSMIGLSQESSKLIEKSLLKEDNQLQLGGFSHINYGQKPVNLLVIDSPELLMFIFEITKSDLVADMVQYYIQLTEIYLLVLDDNDLGKSIESLKEYKQKRLLNSSKNANSITIMLGLNFNHYNSKKRQKIIDVQSEFQASQWFLMDSQGNKKDSSIETITNLSDFFFFACKSYLELCN